MDGIAKSRFEFHFIEFLRPNNGDIMTDIFGIVSQGGKNFHRRPHTESGWAKPNLFHSRTHTHTQSSHMCFSLNANLKPDEGWKVKTIISWTIISKPVSNQNRSLKLGKNHHRIVRRISQFRYMALINGAGIHTYKSLVVRSAVKLPSLSKSAEIFRLGILMIRSAQFVARFAYQNLPSSPPLLSRVRIITKLGEQTDSLALISLSLSACMSVCSSNESSSSFLSFANAIQSRL